MKMWREDETSVVGISMYTASYHPAVWFTCIEVSDEYAAFVFGVDEENYILKMESSGSSETSANACQMESYARESNQ
jgi:hypothetical protein